LLSIKTQRTLPCMPWSLKRFQATKNLHFVTFSCRNRAPHLGTAAARELFEDVLEQVRRRFEFVVVGYVVMPEHVHLLLGEPNGALLSVALQMLKQVTARRARELGLVDAAPFWEKRYFDFNVRTERKRVEKLRYMHRNPVKRELVARPEDWPWSSFRHYALGECGTVEIESEWVERWRPRRTTP